ncbi:MAG: ferric iron uptake transcriptional regulator [Pseudomonadales bacterium]|nr:ferric iron uptake transcriptional regulator [Pseudomonadales bacterium]
MTRENQELRKAGLKITLPRVKILHVLESSQPHHMSAEDVYKSLLEIGEDVGLATIYRVLTQFEDAGLVDRHNFDGGHSVFEIAREGHHDHIVCVSCGKVTEFNDKAIESQQEKVAKKHGFKLRDHCLQLYGECLDANCSRQK